MPPVDEYDFAQRTTSPRLLQGIAAVSTRLSRRGSQLARLEIGQGYDFATGETGESFGDLAFSQRWISGRAGARFDPELGEFSQVVAGLRLADLRGDSLSMRYDWLLDVGTSQMRAGLDDLFGPGVMETESQRQQLDLDATLVPSKGIALRYGITLRPGETEKVLQHRFGLGLGDASDCWRLGLSAFANHRQTGFAWSFGFTLDLKNLGSLGT